MAELETLAGEQEAVKRRTSPKPRNAVRADARRRRRTRPDDTSAHGAVYAQVCGVANRLRRLGVHRGDRVVYLPLTLGQDPGVDTSPGS